MDAVLSLRFDVLMDEQDAFRMNALQLAYLGDSVWELITRYNLAIHGYNVHHMHKECVNLVNAKAQARILNSIMDQLTDEESEIVRRGRNAHPKHTVPRNQSPDDYALATGFESLIGYLYLTGKDQRISNLVNYIYEESGNV